MHTIRAFRKKAAFCRAFGHESRIKIAFLVRTKPRTVTELAQIFRMRRSNVTKHVQRLAHVEIVEGKRQGVHVYFVLTKKARRSNKLWRFLSEMTL